MVGYKTYIKLINTIIQDKQIFDLWYAPRDYSLSEGIRTCSIRKKCLCNKQWRSGHLRHGRFSLRTFSKTRSEYGYPSHTRISAINSAASILGAPLMHDFAVISLSDHLTPWELIEKRLDMAAQADFVIALYNPKSRERRNHLNKAIEIILKHKAPDTPAGIVKNASREGQMVMITTLSEIPKQDVDMTSIIIIGNRHTFTSEGKMITPRGYDI